jgi:hypothetical protein
MCACCLFAGCCPVLRPLPHGRRSPAQWHLQPGRTLCFTGGREGRGWGGVSLAGWLVDVCCLLFAAGGGRGIRAASPQNLPSRFSSEEEREDRVPTCCLAGPAQEPGQPVGRALYIIHSQRSLPSPRASDQALGPVSKACAKSGSAGPGSIYIFRARANTPKRGSI